jgi:hypothetical protein
MPKLIDLENGWFDLIGKVQVQIIQKGPYFDKCEQCQLSIDNDRLWCGNCGTFYRLKGMGNNCDFLVGSVCAHPEADRVTEHGYKCKPKDCRRIRKKCPECGEPSECAIWGVCTKCHDKKEINNPK